MKVLIAYDGSKCADEALAGLARAGLPADAEAVVLAVADVFAPPLPLASGPVEWPALAAGVELAQRARDAAKAAIAEAHAAAERGAARVRTMFPGWTVKAQAFDDTPHWAIVKRAAGWPADLVVVGSHGRGAVARVLLGSVSQQVLHNAPCSVRIGRCGPDAAAADPTGAHRPIRLVIGVDGSADSARAVAAVANRAWPAGTEAHVVGAIDSRAVLAGLGVGPDGVPFADTSEDALTSDAERNVARACAALSAKGLVATRHVVPGDPKRVLLAEAERLGADCIVVGATGHTRLERLLLGSVSAAVAARAHCSVEVVR